MHWAPEKILPINFSPETPSPHLGYSTNPDILLLSLFPVPSQKESYVPTYTALDSSDPLWEVTNRFLKACVLGFSSVHLHSLSLLTLFLTPSFFVNLQSFHWIWLWFFTFHLKELTFFHFPKPLTDSFSLCWSPDLSDDSSPAHLSSPSLISFFHLLAFERMRRPHC